MNSPKIGLALSGGGFRATLFHLGVVRCLYMAGLLPNVRRVTSVSGGSILAAYLAVNWGQFTGDSDAFDSVSKKLVRFTMYDMRGRLLRRWILTWIALLPHALPGKRWTLTNMLKRAYDPLLPDATLSSLPGDPEFNILSTSMTTGSLVTFDRSGVHFAVGPTGRSIPTSTLDLSYAVAASSAFPPLFPPIQIDNKILMCNQNEFSTKEYLTDGGVYDNLGLEKLLASRGNAKDLDLIIVSDAEGSFDWAVDRPYTSVVSRNVRASDMLMSRMSLLRYEKLGTQLDAIWGSHWRRLT